MKNIFLKLITMILMMMLLCSCGSIDDKVEDETETMGVYTDEEEGGEKESKVTYSYVGYYEYPVESYMSPADIIRVCRIDNETLGTMSSEQLAQAVADFPMLIDVSLSGEVQCDTSILKKESDAYAELLTRKDAKNSFIEKIRELEMNSDYEIIIVMLKEIALNEVAFEEYLTEEEKIS